MDLRSQTIANVRILQVAWNEAICCIPRPRRLADHRLVAGAVHIHRLQLAACLVPAAFRLQGPPQLLDFVYAHTPILTCAHVPLGGGVQYAVDVLVRVVQVVDSLGQEFTRSNSFRFCLFPMRLLWGEVDSISAWSSFARAGVRIWPPPSCLRSRDEPGRITKLLALRGSKYPTSEACGSKNH